MDHVKKKSPRQKERLSQLLKRDLKKRSQKVIKLTGEVNIEQAQRDIRKITKKETGFLRPTSRELGLGLEWV